MEHLDESLYQKIDTMKPKELDELPQGAIQLDVSGKILQYNLYEQRLVNVKPEKAVGRNFFTVWVFVRKRHAETRSKARRTEAH